jgi:hypothetical protein
MILLAVAPPARARCRYATLRTDKGWQYGPDLTLGADEVSRAGYDLYAQLRFDQPNDWVCGLERVDSIPRPTFITRGHGINYFPHSLVLRVEIAFIPVSANGWQSLLGEINDLSQQSDVRVRWRNGLHWIRARVISMKLSTPQPEVVRGIWSWTEDIVVQADQMPLNSGIEVTIARHDGNGDFSLRLAGHL